jgi:CPA2 family monovalent cation:H+ antiporter-2
MPASVLIAAVALSLALTPTLAEVGRRWAGRLRRKVARPVDAELTPRSITAPVIIVGMGSVGRTVADALMHFDIGYYAVEHDEARLRTAIADGYHASFGDGFDPRLWQANEVKERRISVLTAPDLEALAHHVQLAKMSFPLLKRFAVVRDENAAQAAREVGLLAVVDRSSPRGLDVAKVVVQELGVPTGDFTRWAAEQIGAAGTVDAMPEPATSPN